jgi:hypothetical protein
MRPAFPLLALTIGLLLSVPPLAAQELIETNSGSKYTGTIVSDDGTSIELETSSGTMKLPWESLTLKTQYRLQRAKSGPDARSQLELAEWCVGKTLYEEARTHFRRALAADASMAEEINEKVVVARKTAADELLARARSLQDSNPRESRRLLSALVQELPLEEAAKEAQQLLAADTEQRKEDTLTRARTPSPADAAGAAGGIPTRASGEPFSEQTVQRFEPIIVSYKKLLDATRDGLLKGGTGGIKEFEKALKEGEKIRKAAETIRPQAFQDEELTEAVALVDTKLEEALVDVRLNLVDNYMLRTSYKQAADVVQAGLAEYPRNERLRQAMDRVTAAAADNGGGDWVIVRPR